MKLKELLNDHQTGMSQFQDDFFVTTRAGGTLYGQYKQALRELYKRFRGLRELTAGHARLQIEIEELKYKISSLTGVRWFRTVGKEFDLRRAQVDYKEKVMLMEESQRSIKDTKREFTRFFQQAAHFKEKIGSLTDEKRYQLDMEMWEFKIKEMGVIDLVTTGRIRNSTFEFLHSCPKEMKLKLGRDFKDQNGLLEWYENKEEEYISKDLPEIEPFKNIEEIFKLEYK